MASPSPPYYTPLKYVFVSLPACCGCLVGVGENCYLKFAPPWGDIPGMGGLKSRRPGPVPLPLLPLPGALLPLRGLSPLVGKL
jgi:hypothetical protein